MTPRLNTIFASDRTAGMANRKAINRCSAGGSTFREQFSKLSNRGEYFLIPVSALSVVGALLHFDDFLVLVQDPVGEPRQERPHQFQRAGNFGASH